MNQREYPPIAIHKLNSHLMNLHVRDIDPCMREYVPIGKDGSAIFILDRWTSCIRVWASSWDATQAKYLPARFERACP